MFESKASEYFPGAHDHFLMPATEVRERNGLSLALDYLQHLACLELGVNIKFILGLP